MYEKWIVVMCEKWIVLCEKWIFQHIRRVRFASVVQRISSVISNVYDCFRVLLCSLYTIEYSVLSVAEPIEDMSILNLSELL